jgi:hypothetical protein
MPKKTLTVRLVPIAAISVFLLSACGGEKASPTPSVDAIYTSAAQTVAVQISLTAAAQPSSTPISTSTPQATNTLPSLSTFTSFPTLAGFAISSGACNSAYVADVTIPDNMSMAPNQSFTKTWKLKNTGSCTWTTAFKLVFISGDNMNATSTNLAASVAPNQESDISIALQAPNKAGTLTSIWRLQDDQGQYFGTTITVVINTGGATLTVTPTGPTPTKTTSSASATSTTAAPSNTPTITSTPSDSPTPPTPAP